MGQHRMIWMSNENRFSKMLNINNFVLKANLSSNIEHIITDLQSQVGLSPSPRSSPASAFAEEGEGERPKR